MENKSNVLRNNYWGIRYNVDRDYLNIYLRSIRVAMDKMEPDAGPTRLSSAVSKRGRDNNRDQEELRLKKPREDSEISIQKDVPILEEGSEKGQASK